MATVERRIPLPAVIAVSCYLMFFPLASVAQTSPGVTAVAVSEIELSFKRDPRMVDPFRGVAPWVTGSEYNGATAQDTVEVRAAGLVAGGKPIKIDPIWTASDNAMVTISPRQGDDVKITVLKAGESKLTITYQKLSKELVIRAKYVGKFILFEIAPAPSTLPTGPTAEMSPKLRDQKAQLSYAAGMRMAETLRKQSVEVEPDLVRQGIADVIAGGPTLMSEAQVQAALMSVETELNVTAAELDRRRVAEANSKAGEAFLAANRQRTGVVALPSGLQYKIIKAGNGKKPSALDIAVCQYKGTLIDGTEFDNSRKQKDGAPVNFPVRAVIRGWQEALRLMPAGSTWQLFVPPELAYGDRGAPRAKIPPNATLVFEVELLSVKKPGTQDPQPADAGKPNLTPAQIDEIKNAVHTAAENTVAAESEGAP